jgi:aconitate hydratase
MGVLPLEFKPGTDRKTLGRRQRTYDVLGERTPRATLTLVVTGAMASVSKCR